MYDRKLYPELYFLSFVNQTNSLAKTFAFKEMSIDGFALEESLWVISVLCVWLTILVAIFVFSSPSPYSVIMSLLIKCIPVIFKSEKLWLASTNDLDLQIKSFKALSFTHKNNG